MKVNIEPIGYEFIKLPKKDKESWIKGLRSGKYKQYKNGGLYSRGEGYCCLGVLSHVKGVPCSVIGSCGYYSDHCGDWETPDIDTVLEQPARGAGHLERALARVNDSGNHTFNEIADWIEENL